MGSWLNNARHGQVEMNRHNGSNVASLINNNINQLHPNFRNTFSSNNTPGRGVRRVQGFGHQGPRVFIGPNGLNANEFVPTGVLHGTTYEPSPQCITTAVRDGVRSDAFKQCFTNYLRGKVTPATCEHDDKLTPPQIKLYEKAKIIATAAEAGCKDRGQLVWVNTGGGKTIMALSLILAYWDTPRKIYIITTVNNKNDNNPEKYVANLKKFFPAQYEAIYRSLGGDMRKAFGDDKSGARAIFLSYLVAGHKVSHEDNGGRRYATHGNFKFWDGDGCVCIIDEAQGLSDPIFKRANTLESQQAIKLGQRLRALTRPQREKVHCYPLSATPGKTLEHWLQILSIVRRVDDDLDFPARTQELAQSMRSANVGRLTAFARQHMDGLVFYGEMRGDLQTHACVRELTKLVPMDRWYYASMLFQFSVISRANATTSRGNVAVLSNHVPSAAYSKVVPQNVIDTIRKRKRFLSTGHWVSNKIILLTHFLVHKPGKHFVYTREPEFLASVLEAWYGLKDVSSEALRNGPQFANVTSKPAFVVMNGKEGGTTKKLLNDAYNAPRNAHGTHIKLLIAGGRNFEGSDHKALRYVHIVEPMDTARDERQLVGRGVRFCAHKSLSARDRTVSIVRWYLTTPPKKSRDELLQFIRRHSGTITAAKQRALREVEIYNAGRLAEMGLDRQLRYDALHNQEVVDVFNFEAFVRRRASGRSNVAFVPSPTVRVIAGKPCA